LLPTPNEIVALGMAPPDCLIPKLLLSNAAASALSRNASRPTGMVTTTGHRKEGTGSSAISAGLFSFNGTHAGLSNSNLSTASRYKFKKPRVQLIYSVSTVFLTLPVRYHLHVHHAFSQVR